MEINKKFIFTVTSGRSGTGYLAEILSKHQEVYCAHEAVPSFGTHFREIQTNPAKAKEFWLKEKLPEIKRQKQHIYIETSHLFCKGYLEPLLESGIIPDLIVLERPSRETAKSLFQLNTIPGRTEKALRFYLSPDDPRIMLPFPEWEQANDYQLCFWYTLDTMIRQKRYSMLVNNLGGKVVTTSIENLKIFEQVKSLILNLGIRKPDFGARNKIRKSLDRKINTKVSMKAEFPFSASELFQYEDEVYKKTSFFELY